MYNNSIPLAVVAIAFVVMLTGCSDNNTGTKSARPKVWYRHLHLTQAQKDQLNKEILKQGSGKIRKPGTSGFVEFGQIK